MSDKRKLSVILILLLALLAPGIVDRVLLALSALLVLVVGWLHSDSGAEEPRE